MNKPLNPPRVDVFLPPPTVPVADSYGGVGHYDVFDDAKFVDVRVGPWESMNPGDVVRIYWDGRLAATRAVGDATEAFLVGVNAVEIKEGRQQTTVPVHYEVTFYPSDESEFSAPIDVLVDLTVPGGFDPQPSTPENENLGPIEGLPENVSPGQALTLTVPAWIHQEIDDVVTISWNGFRKTARTTALGPLPFVFSADDVAQGGSGEIVVQYEIRDRVNNWSRWSPRQTTLADDPNRLPPPEIIDADAFDTLDLDLLDGRDAQVRVRYVLARSRSRIAQGDWITLTVRRRSADGSELPDYVDQKQVGLPVPSFVRFDVPNGELAVLADGDATFSYTVRSPGKDEALSSPKMIHVTGSPSVGLPAPAVEQASAGQLPPASAANGITLLVPAAADILPGDQVTATFGAHTSLPAPGTSGGMRILLPASAVSPHFGRKVAAFYTRTRSGTPRTSEAVEITVGDIGHGDPLVAPPTIAEADPDGAVHLGGFVGDATIRVAPWPFMAPGQRYWLYANAGASRLTVVDGETLSQASALDRALSRGWLQSLNDGSSFTVTLAIAFGGGEESTSKAFVSRPYVIREDATAPLKLAGPSTLKKGETHTFVAEGGTRPYRYASDAPLVASIVADTGICTAVDTGKARITVTDAKGATAYLDLTIEASEWDETFDFDAVQPPFRNLSSKEDQIRNPLRFDKVFDWRFDRGHLPSKEQFIGVKTLDGSKPPVDDYYKANVLRIGDDTGGTYNEKIVFCDFFKAWSVVRFAASSLDDPITVSFQDENNQIIGSVIKLNPSKDPQEVKSVVAGTRKIKRIEIRCPDTIHLDFFKMKT